MLTFNPQAYTVKSKIKKKQILQICILEKSKRPEIWSEQPMLGKRTQRARKRQYFLWE